PTAPGLGEQRPVIAQLGPLDASTIDVVVSFVAAGPQGLAEEQAVVSLGSQLFTLLVGPSNSGGDLTDDGEPADGPPAVVTQTTGRPLRIDLPGLDAASERIREEARQRLGGVGDEFPDDEGMIPEDEAEAWLFDVARSLAQAWQARDRAPVRETAPADAKPAAGPQPDHADAGPKEAAADADAEG
ncbi:MAG TPA: hypothetical protein VFA26_23325, partial [Gemmataceae bacterium]|nr:hypothetical protein [Gemmataceae bacterium]